MNRAVFRVSLPIVLLIGGVALSCSSACVTSAVVDGVAGATAASKRVAAHAVLRNSIEREVTPLLPPPSKAAAQTDRVRIAGPDADDFYLVGVSGDFSPENAAQFMKGLHQLPAHGIPFGTRLKVSVFNDATSPSKLVGQYELDFVKELADELRRQLPLPNGKVAPSDRLRVVSNPDLSVFAVGDFTPERARAFADFARELPKRFPGLPRLRITMWQDSATSAVLKQIEQFDSGLPNGVTP